MGGVVDPVRGQGLAESPEEVEGSVQIVFSSANVRTGTVLWQEGVRDEPSLVEADVVAREGPAVVAGVEVVA